MINEREPHNLRNLLIEYEAAASRLAELHTREPRDEDAIERARDARDRAIEEINEAYYDYYCEIETEHFYRSNAYTRR